MTRLHSSLTLLSLPPNLTDSPKRYPQDRPVVASISSSNGNVSAASHEYKEHQNKRRRPHETRAVQLLASCTKDGGSRTELNYGLCTGPVGLHIQFSVRPHTSNGAISHLTNEVQLGVHFLGSFSVPILTLRRTHSAIPCTLRPHFLPIMASYPKHDRTTQGILSHKTVILEGPIGDL